MSKFDLPKPGASTDDVIGVLSKFHECMETRLDQLAEQSRLSFDAVRALIQEDRHASKNRDHELGLRMDKTDKVINRLTDPKSGIATQVQELLAHQEAVKNDLAAETKVSREFRERNEVYQDLMLRAFRLERPTLPLSPETPAPTPKARLAITLTPWQVIAGTGTLGGLYVLLLKVVPVLPAINRALVGGG
jgi:hypothetical protein